MTFSQEDAKPLYRDYPMFMQWILSKDIRLLFFPREILESNELYKYDLTSKAYLFMKRLHTDFNTFMRMDETTRERIFRMEVDLIEKENKAAEEAKKKNG